MNSTIQIENWIKYDWWSLGKVFLLQLLFFYFFYFRCLVSCLFVVNVVVGFSHEAHLNEGARKTRPEKCRDQWAESGRGTTCLRHTLNRILHAKAEFPISMENWGKSPTAQNSPYMGRSNANNKSGKRATKLSNRKLTTIAYVNWNLDCILLNHWLN